MKWGARREKPDATVLYLCNPDLNEECSKISCFCNEGPCRHTVRKDCAIDNEYNTLYYSRDGETFIQIGSIANDASGKLIIGDDYEYAV